MAEGGFIPLSAPEISGREEEYVLDCLRSTWISSKGAYIERFEKAFAAFVGTRHALSCNNGTSALHLALLALGVGAGDEVIVPTLTYVASANAVRYCGATPRFVDIEPGTWNLDVADVERKLTDRTRAIMAVHLFGAPADMQALVELADSRGVPVVEDAAEAHGAMCGDTLVGSIGRVGTFSFYGNKVVTTGEGGMVVTNDSDLARRVLLLKGQGQDFDRPYWFPVIGFNYRMTNIEAAIGLAQLESVDEKLEKRRRVAERYRRQLGSASGIESQLTSPGSRHANWMTVVLLPVEGESDRDAIGERLTADGIETRPVFYPVHTLPPYAPDEPDPDGYPVATDVAARGICLPTWPAMTDDDIDYVCDRLTAAVGHTIRV